MKRIAVIVVGVLALGTAGALMLRGAQSPAPQPTPPQTAAVRHATFAISNMTCATCPITVRKAMAGVSGVSTVSVDFDTKRAVVDFDSSETTVAAIAAASTNAGYPAREIKS